jgi:hypothetical protein
MAEISLGELGIHWFEDAIRLVTEWFRLGLAEGYEAVTPLLFGTPTPTTRGALIFGTPTNAPWPMLHDVLVGGEITVVALLMLVIAVQGRHAIRVFNFGSGYEARRTKRTAWTGGFFIVIWYWVAALTLLLVEGFTFALLPDIDVVIHAMQQWLTVSLHNPALGLLMASVGGIAMWVLQALFFIRRLLILIYVYAMPFGIALAFANLPVISRIAWALCLRFVPLAMLPLPVALLFAGYGFLFGGGTSAFGAVSTPFLQLLVATSLPVLGVWIAWKTFGYAAPAIARITGTVGRTAMTAGAIAGVSAAGGPALAAAAGREGPRNALRTAAAAHISAHSPPGDIEDDEDSVRDAYGQAGVPAYRRTENDPGYY